MDTLKCLTGLGMPLRPSSFAGSKEQAMKLSFTQNYTASDQPCSENQNGVLFFKRKTREVHSVEGYWRGLLVLSSCWPSQPLHVFTTTFPLRFQSLASRARTQLSISLQILCQQRNPLPELCFLPDWRMPCPPVALVSDPAVSGVHVLWSR